VKRKKPAPPLSLIRTHPINLIYCADVQSKQISKGLTETKLIYSRDTGFPGHSVGLRSSFFLSRSLWTFFSLSSFSLFLPSFSLSLSLSFFLSFFPFFFSFSSLCSSLLLLSVGLFVFVCCCLLLFIVYLFVVLSKRATWTIISQSVSQSVSRR